MNLEIDLMISGANARNAAISIAGQAFRFIVRFVGLAIISRLLEPGEVGIAAIVITVVGLAGVLGDFGLSLAAIAAPRLSDQQSSNLFWLNLLIGAVLTGSILLGAPSIAAMFGVDATCALILMMAPVFLISSAGIQHRVLITRRHQYGALAMAEGMAPLGGVIIGICVASSGAGAISVVVQEVCTAIFLLIAYISVSKWWPKVPTGFGNIKEFFGFSVATTGMQVVNYLSTYSPQWFIAGIIGTGGAGQFSRAYQVLMLPIQQLAGPLTRVALPLLANSKEERFSENFHKVQTLLTYALCFPLLVIAIVAGPLIEVALGPGWDEAATLLSIMCVGGCFQSAGYAYYWAFLARNRANALFLAELFGRVPMLFLVYVGATIGTVATASAFSIGLFLVWIASSVQAGRKLPISSSVSRGVHIRGLGAGLGAFGLASLTAHAWPLLSAVDKSAVTLLIFLLLMACMTISRAFRQDVKLVWSVVGALRR